MSGHRPAYVRRVANHALELGYRVKLVTSQAHQELEDLENKFASSQLLSVFYRPAPRSASKLLPNNLTLIWNELFHRRWYRSVEQDKNLVSETDIKLVLTADNIINTTGLLGSPFKTGLWCGILMRQSFHYAPMGIIGPAPTLMLKIKRLLFFRALSRCQNCLFFTIDSALQVYIANEHLAKYSKKIAFLPDPVDPIGLPEQNNLNEIIPFDKDDHVILVFGSLRPAKGVDRLLKALPSSNERVKLILAGKQRSDIEKMINELISLHPQCKHRIFQINRYIEKSEEFNLFNAASTVWLGYVNHFGMSGVLLQAAIHSRPVIATKQGLIGWYTKRYRLGIICDPMDNQSIIDALESSLNQSEQDHSDYDFEGATNKHTLSMFNEVLFEGIKSLRLP